MAWHGRVDDNYQVLIDSFKTNQAISDLTKHLIEISAERKN